MTDGATWAPRMPSAMTPVPYRVRTRVIENFESTTICLEPVGQCLVPPLAGQFTMLYAFGVGEIPMSVSGDPTVTDGTVTHTIRSLGAVSRALRDARVGTIVGVRGPFGTNWGVESAAGRDLVIVAGGCGLAPLRPAILQVLADRVRFSRVVLIAGARTPQHFLFREQADQWAHNPLLEVQLSIDQPAPTGWSGQVGVVTGPLRRISVTPERTTAFICGPEPMIRFAAAALLDKGMAAGDIRVSLERNMQCGIGWCGHCQLGPLLLCLDGPVVGYDVAEPLLRIKEL